VDFKTYLERCAVKLKVSSGGIPPGTYAAEFVGVEAQEANEYGAGLKWTWRIISGPHAGATATRITGPAPTRANACGKILAGLLGRPLAEGEDVDTTALKGRRYFIVVEATEKGGSKVANVSAPPTA
jgi:hypothetical protein